VVLIFALQKLSSVSSSTRMSDHMPIVSGLGEQFAWANLLFLPNQTHNSSWWGGNANGTNSTEGLVTLATGIPARIARSLARGHKGASTLARIASRRFANWERKRVKRNETYTDKLVQKGGEVVEVMRKLRARSGGRGRGDIGGDARGNGTNSSLDLCDIYQGGDGVAAGADGAAVDTAAVDTFVPDASMLDSRMATAFENNLIMVTSIFCFVTLVHVFAYKLVAIPHRVWLLAHVHHHSVHRPHLASPHLFGRPHLHHTLGDVPPPAPVPAEVEAAAKLQPRIRGYLERKRVEKAKAQVDATHKIGDRHSGEGRRPPSLSYISILGRAALDTPLPSMTKSPRNPTKATPFPPMTPHPMYVPPPPPPKASTAVAGTHS
jgi:hypothetical protein